MSYNEEIICGFKVTAKRKAIWAEELKLTKHFIDICNKHNLKYVLSGGTLLGAIRHGGYIPWDDDIDIMMPRADYEKFLKCAQNELPENLFLQCLQTEKSYSNGHAQIRNSNTTCLIKSNFADLKLGKNLGVFIDIFPYDNVPEDYKQRQKFAKKIKKLKWFAFNKHTVKVTSIKSFIKFILVKAYYLFHSEEKTIKKIDVLSQKYNGKTDLVALTTFIPGYERNVWKSELFDEVIPHCFEDITASIPKHYHEVLTHEFGDYMQIPEDKGGSMHGTIYFDLQKSYKDYADISEEEFLSLFENVDY